MRFIAIFMGLIQLGVCGCAGRCLLSSCSGMRTVRFQYTGEARSVCIAGDFNQWAVDSHCLAKNQEGWSIALSLPHGPMHYAFFIDGRRWAIDPRALYWESDGFGRQNSVVMIE